jgi:hypothetical protein
VKSQSSGLYKATVSITVDVDRFTAIHACTLDIVLSVVIIPVMKKILIQQELEMGTIYCPQDTL